MTRPWLVVALLGLTAPSPAPLDPVVRVELAGEWQDDENFSGAALVGDLLLVASDELGILQVGRRDPANAGRFTLSGDIRLVPQKGGEEVEADFEALARSGDEVYALGSHSMTRRRGDRPAETHATNLAQMSRGPRAHPERDVLFRFTVDPATITARRIRSTSLRAAIDGQPLLKPFAALPSKENGVDLEGLAADGEWLYAGFRGPVLRHGYAPVLRFRFDALPASTLLLVPLDGRGVRDLAKVSDGFLVLAGPVGDGDTPHRLYWWNGNDCVAGRGGPGGQLRLLGDVPAEGEGKAEAVVVLADDAAGYRLMVLFDSRPRGAAIEWRVGRAPAAETPSTRLCGGAA